LLIYKLESYNIFKKMVDDMNRKAISILMRGQIPMAENNVREAGPQRRADNSRYRMGRENRQAGGPPQEKRVEPIRREEKKIGRNEPCPCGSGKKYKQCHGKE
jgi:preprotein translocase subunit SecA